MQVWYPLHEEVPPEEQATAFCTDEPGFVDATGLRCNEWRRTMPSPALYRPWVRQRFEGVPSAAGGSYTPAAAAVRSSMASGRTLVFNFTQPCPALVKQDCQAIWVAWGECEAGGTQVMRYTVEQDAVLGGVECAHGDGFEQARAC